MLSNDWHATSGVGLSPWNQFVAWTGHPFPGISPANSKHGSKSWPQDRGTTLFAKQVTGMDEQGCMPLTYCKRLDIPPPLAQVECTNEHVCHATPMIMCCRLSTKPHPTPQCDEGQLTETQNCLSDSAVYVTILFEVREAGWQWMHSHTLSLMTAWLLSGWPMHRTQLKPAASPIATDGHGTQSDLVHHAVASPSR